MKEEELTVRYLDAAFSAETSVLSLIKMLPKVKVGFMLAVIAW